MTTNPMTMVDSPMQVFGAQQHTSIVQILNDSDETFRRRYGPNQVFELPPHGAAMVIEEIAWHFVGRWWTNNNNPRMRERASEVQRLRTFYGAYEDDELWEAVKPRLRVFTPDGTEIVTVLDDPEGKSAQPGPTPMGREASLERQVEWMHSQLVAMQQQLDTVRSEEAAQMVPPPPADPGPPTPASPVGSSVEVGPAGTPPVQVAPPPVLPAPPAPTAPVPGPAMKPGQLPPDVAEQAVLTDGSIESAPARLPTHAEPVPVDGDGPPPVAPKPPRSTRVGGG